MFYHHGYVDIYHVLDQKSRSKFEAEVKIWGQRLMFDIYISLAELPFLLFSLTVVTPFPRSFSKVKQSTTDGHFLMT